ncbi:hypothetical protein [Streptomyces paludis]|uniref:Uncharacterized protein n=1 Tax=Streptomyces paludis TaxID=2282738 RepID=A0A345HZU2_9ACTN|nr:hypothetical protein [Streptomyces paludis]AXG82216.1 hypothetical protein DVK44_36045 [Streptomyces paludis]
MDSRSSHSEEIAVGGETEPVIVNLSARISNTKSKHDRLTTEQLTALAALSMDCAGPWDGPLPGRASGRRSGSG